MLSQKKDKKASLTIVRKPGVKVIDIDTSLPVPVNHKKGKTLSPPANQFNTGYIKVKRHDPL